MSKPFEVWVSSDPLPFQGDFDQCDRFNARFSTWDRAFDEVIWYQRHGYRAKIVDTTPREEYDYECDGPFIPENS